MTNNECNLFLLFGLVITKDPTSDLRYSLSLPHVIFKFIQKGYYCHNYYNYLCSIELVSIVIAMK